MGTKFTTFCRAPLVMFIFPTTLRNAGLVFFGYFTAKILHIVPLKR